MAAVLVPHRDSHPRLLVRAGGAISSGTAAARSTVFIDGQPWAGLDVAHPYCILPDRACTLWLDCGTYQTCIWFDSGKPIDQYGLRFEGAWIACRNPAAWETYWDLDVLVEWMVFLLKRDGLENMARPWGPIPEPRQAHPVLRKLMGMLDEAFTAWEKGGASALGLDTQTHLRRLPRRESGSPR